MAKIGGFCDDGPVQEVLTLDGWWLGILSYAIAHLAHIVIWRIHPVERDVRVLFAILLVVPLVLWLALLAWIPGASYAALLVHLALAANYIAIYPALQATSPTIEMLYLMGKTPGGVSEENLVGLLGGEKLVEHRISDLERGDLVKRKDGKLILGTKGKGLANVFYLYRKLIGLPSGAG